MSQDKTEVVVTQADREKAIELATILFGNGHSITNLLRSTERHFMLDAFASHRPLTPAQAAGPVGKFSLGERVTKTKGSAWTGKVVGFYSTNLTPIGYAIESENEPGSVQIYPESALAAIRALKP